MLVKFWRSDMIFSAQGNDITIPFASEVQIPMAGNVLADDIAE